MVTIEDFAAVCKDKKPEEIEEIYNDVSSDLKEQILSLADKSEKSPKIAAFKIIGHAYNVGALITFSY